MNSQIILNDLNALLSALDRNIREVTTNSTVEALQLFESLASLKRKRTSGKVFLLNSTTHF